MSPYSTSLLVGNSGNSISLEQRAVLTLCYSLSFSCREGRKHKCVFVALTGPKSSTQGTKHCINHPHSWVVGSFVANLAVSMALGVVLLLSTPLSSLFLSSCMHTCAHLLLTTCHEGELHSQLDNLLPKLNHTYTLCITEYSLTSNLALIE